MFDKPARIIIPLVVFVVFVVAGDKFLPQPVAGASFQTRRAIVQFVYGLVPGWEPKTNPYERTEEAIEETQEGSQK